MRRADQTTQNTFGLDGSVLMERAALGVCRRIETWWGETPHGNRPGEVLIYVGTGNNGGDGVAVGRILSQRGFHVQMRLLGPEEKRSEGLCAQLRTVMYTTVEIRDSFAGTTPDIIVDAMLGIGCSRPLTGEMADATAEITAYKAARGTELFVIAVDIPTGVNSDDGSVAGVAVRADATVTFAWEKLGLILYPGCTYAGEVSIEDIGVTQDAFLGQLPRTAVLDETVEELRPRRERAGNKGTFGKVLVAAGNAQVTGAAVLCAEAVLRTGAGMVRVCTHENGAQTLRVRLPEALLNTWHDQDSMREQIRAALGWADTVVAGPGIGTDEMGAALLREILDGAPKKLVLDADALNLIAADQELRKRLQELGCRTHGVILTPHLAEFARLRGSCSVKECRIHLLAWPAEMAEALGAVVVCKDARSLVAPPGFGLQYLNISGNDGMATAGSGDVLAGVIAALFAAGLPAEKAAAAGVRIHGLAGDAAAKRLGRCGMIAGDIVAELPAVQ